MTFLFRTPNASSLALQCLAYRALGHEGQDENAPLEVIPESLRKPKHIPLDKPLSFSYRTPCGAHGASHYPTGLQSHISECEECQEIMNQPTEGKCIHCGHTTEDQDEGEFLHEACRDELIAEQERDWRLDDPRRGQARELNRMRGK